MRNIFLGALLTCLFAPASWAANVYVMDAHAPDLSIEDASAATESVENAVNRIGTDTLVEDREMADIVLQPVVRKQGDAYTLRVDSVQGSRQIASSDMRAESIDDFNRVALVATDTVMRGQPQTGTQIAGQPSGQAQPSVSGATEDQDIASDSSRRQRQSRSQMDSRDQRGSMSGATSAGMGGQSVAAAADQGGAFAKPNRFSVGAGPAFSAGLENDNVMYRIGGGYFMNFHPSFAAKVIGELNLPTGDDEARFLNFGVGGNFYIPQDIVTVGRPYATADVGFGFTRDNEENRADGLSVGAGVGYEFAATQATNLDVLLRYTLLTNDIQDDLPSIFGAQLAINF